MKFLKGELLIDGKVENVSKMNFDEMNSESFIFALVSVCNDINADIPIWTAVEERIFRRKLQIILPLKANSLLKLSLI